MLQHLRDAFVEKLDEQREQEPHCLVRWSDDKKIDVIAQKDIRLPPSARVKISQLCTVVINGQRRHGTVLATGTKKECELAQYKLTPHRPAPNAEDASASSSAKNPSNLDLVNEMLLLRVLERLISNSKSESLAEDVHHAECASCGMSPMRGTDRYRCLECPSSPGYDLCSRCFERRHESKQHLSGHAVAHFKLPNELLGIPVNNVNEEVTLNKLRRNHSLLSERHEGIVCDGDSHHINFVGLRFKCDTCPNYDLCEDCALKRHVISKGHKRDHPLVLTSNRVIPQIDVDDIELGEILGRGAFGYVCKATWRSKNRQVACKVIEVSGASSTSEQLERSFHLELAAYRELSGSYILRTFGYATRKLPPTRARRSTTQFMIIMELMGRGSLKNLLTNEPKKISLRRKLTMARQIAMGMRRIHQHGMIHRDIRPDNILVNEDYVAKLGDLGIARVMDPHNRQTQIGCIEFMPPEFFRDSADGNVQCDEKLDIYTFGLTLNQLFTETQHDFRFGSSPRAILVKQSPIFYDDIIVRCLEADSKRRPSAVEIEKTLELYEQAFSETMVSDAYTCMKTSEKDRAFTDFYRKIKSQVQEIVRKRFPPQFINEVRIEVSGQQRRRPTQPPPPENAEAESPCRVN